MDEKIEEEIVEYVRRKAPILFIVLDRNRKIVEMNEFASKVLDDKVLGKEVDQIFLSFDGSLDIDELISNSVQNRKLDLDTSSDLPDSFIFSFHSLEKNCIVFGKPDVDELENLRQEMVSLNNEFANLSRELQKKNAELRRTQKAFKSSLNGVAITNNEGVITVVNPMLLGMWGYDRKEVVGEDITKLFTNKNDDIMDSLEKKEQWVGEFKAEKKDGREFYVQGLASVIENEKRGREGIVFTFLDITKRRKIKERRDLLHSVLRHDVKNKVQIVQGYLQLAEDDESLSKDAGEYIKKAIKGNKENINLIQKIRLLQNAEEEEIKTVDVSKKVNQAVEMNELMAEEEGIDISVNSSSKSCFVLGGSLLKEVFSNIIENSIYHSGCDEIKVSFEEDEENTIVIIEDDGKGISDDEKESIFKKGYTTDEKRGTGLGLFLIKMLLDIYGGSIEVKDSDIGGARFDVVLNKAE